MDCPIDKIEMKEKFGRVPMIRLSNKDLKTKTKVARYWECPHCLKQYIVAMRLVEIRGAVPTFEHSYGKPIDKNLQVVQH